MSKYEPMMHGARCDICPLKGQKIVPPEGDSPIVIVGECPGKLEEQQGRPFVAATGMKLQELLRKAGLPPREELHLTNALLCRPAIPEEYGKKRYDLKGYLAWLRKENVRRKKAKEPLLVNPFDACGPRLRAELQRAELLAREANKAHPSQFPSGAIVFPVGNFALAQVMGQRHSMSVLKYRGSVMPVPADVVGI